jgi:hypothetical protein
VTDNDKTTAIIPAAPVVEKARARPGQMPAV